ncbi:MAG: 6-phosphofructokinase [Patescibacteria group bacterium]
MKKAKVVIFQGGGPISTHNWILMMMVLELLRLGVRHIYGARRGVGGIAAWNVVDLGQLPIDVLLNVAATPGAALRSARDVFTPEVLQMLMAQGVSHVIGIGGNDTALSIKNIGEAAKIANYPIVCVHAAKTVDNDLRCCHVTPGYPSAAWCVAERFTRLDIDTTGMSRVHVAAVMGRLAGFLTGASALGGADIILLPENWVVMDDVVAQIENIYSRRGKCLVAVSEGIRNTRGVLMADVASSQAENDPHGNRKLEGGLAVVGYVCEQIKARLKNVEVRGETVGYDPRAAKISAYDQDISTKIGVEAARFAMEDGHNGSIAVVNKRSTITTAIVPLVEVAGKEKFRVMDQRFIDKERLHVTDAFINYVRPMIGPLPEFHRFPGE